MKKALLTILVAAFSSVPSLGCAADKTDVVPSVTCTNGQQKVYVTYILASAKRMDGVGGSFYCIPVGAETTEVGFEHMRIDLSRRLKQAVVILQVQKLTA